MAIEEPLLLLRKHLTSIYEQISRNEKTLADFMQKTSWDIDNLQRQKLSTQEFGQFIDEFDEALKVGLPILKEKSASVTVAQPKEEPSSESESEYNKTVLAVPDQKSGETLQRLELMEAQNVEQERVAQEQTGFPIKTLGEVFHVRADIVSVTDDVKIPSRTTVDKILVVKGSFKTGENCTILKDLKALKDIVIGPYTKVEGTLFTRGKITIGNGCTVHGSVECEGEVEIDEGTVIEGVLRSKSSIVLNKSAKALQAVYAAKGLSVMKAT
jgi:cytoskeletal protein CcmA (bactofilin family)